MKNGKIMAILPRQSEEDLLLKHCPVEGLMALSVFAILEGLSHMKENELQKYAEQWLVKDNQTTEQATSALKAVQERYRKFKTCTEKSSSNKDLGIFGDLPIDDGTGESANCLLTWDDNSKE